MTGTRQANWWPRFRLIDTADVPPDPDVAARVALYEATIAKDLERRIGTPCLAGQPFGGGARRRDRHRQPRRRCRQGRHRGRYRAHQRWRLARQSRLPADSPISQRDVLAELPFGNKALVLEITGGDLKEALEQSLAGAERPTAAFPQVSGLEVHADVTCRPENGSCR
jgi:5'-nucleotidase / UDP-sugar diphosphatase